MRKRSNKQAFSLFAFQDIITGVTAIILLFTLLLVLELVTRKATQAAQASSTESAQQLSELAANMNEVQTIDIDSLQQAPTQEQVLAIVKDRMDSLTESIAATEKDQKKVDEQSESLEEKRRQTQLELRNEIDQSPQTRETDAGNKKRLSLIQSLNLQIRSVKDEIEINKQTAKMPQGPPILKFRDKNKDRGGSCLVVLEHNRIVVITIKEGTKLSWAGRSAARQFETWLTANELGVDHCVILIRPSGISQFDAVQNIIDAKGIAVGKEAIGEGQEIQITIPESI